VPTNKQRREAARRHLERQLQRRQETDVKRKQRNLIITIISSVLVVLVVVGVLIAIIDDHKKSKASAAASPSVAATDTGSASDSAAPSTSAAPMPQTAGPCGYTQTATATKNVGFPPDPKPTPTVNRTVVFTTNKGPITLAMDGAMAPCTVQSIAYLVGKGLYNNTSCFRLVTQGIYVLQCGDPANNGTGGPGYQVKDENLDKVDYSVVGTVAMANSGPGTDGSQFFIIYKDSSANLGKSYTEIGHITTGLNIVLAEAAAGETDADPSNAPGDGTPKSMLTIMKATVVPPVVGSGTMVTPAGAAVPSGSGAVSAPAVSAPPAAGSGTPTGSG
jgi:peptidyl-prolyl cis-trans isomerase B (cyclophilin B)